MATLYRKYRPRNFEQVVNQKVIKTILENQVQTGAVAHAYLFCGPRAVGKTTLARVFSKAINCLDRKEGRSEPCNKCRSCKEMDAGNNLDVTEIDAASNTGIDNVRDNIIASSRVASSNSKYRVFIVDEVHMISIQAFNALLKTLEEPPENVVFILCTTEVHKMPDTIISRCQRFDFKKIGVSDITEKLKYIVKNEKIKIDRSILESIARLSEGHMRDAESILAQIVSIGGKEIGAKEADLVIPRSDISRIIDVLESLSEHDASRGLGVVNQLVNDGVDLNNFAKELIELSRKIMIRKINPELASSAGLDLGEDMEGRIADMMENISVENISAIIARFIDAKNELKSSFIIQLPFELAIIDLCSGRDAPGEENQSAPKQTPPNEAPGDNPTPKGNTAGMGIEDIEAGWKNVVARAKHHNHSLPFILSACKPMDIQGDEILIVFKHKFHCDRIQDQKVREILESILSEVYNTRLRVKAEVREDIFPSAGSEENDPQKNKEKEGGDGDDQVLDDITEIFEGKVVK